MAVEHAGRAYIYICRACGMEQGPNGDQIAPPWRERRQARDVEPLPLVLRSLGIRIGY